MVLAAFLAVFLSAGTAEASFLDWFKVDGDSQQAEVGTKTKKAKKVKTYNKTYNLKVNISGWGNITSDDGKINCGKGNDRANSDCSENYAGPTTVTLTAPAYTVYSSDKNYVSLRLYLFQLDRCLPRTGKQSNLRRVVEKAEQRRVRYGSI